MGTKIDWFSFCLDGLEDKLCVVSTILRLSLSVANKSVRPVSMGTKMKFLHVWKVTEIQFWPLKSAQNPLHPFVALHRVTKTHFCSNGRGAGAPFMSFKWARKITGGAKIQFSWLKWSQEFFSGTEIHFPSFPWTRKFSFLSLYKLFLSLAHNFIPVEFVGYTRKAIRFFLTWSGKVLFYRFTEHQIISFVL